MSSESELNVDDLHKLRDLYDALEAALDEYHGSSERMPAYDAEHAFDIIQDRKRDIESFEESHPKAAAACHEE
jgi:hypothetical protein